MERFTKGFVQITEYRHENIASLGKSAIYRADKLCDVPQLLYIYTSFIPVRILLRYASDLSFL